MGDIDSIVITTLAERPALIPRIYEFADTWPEFVHHDPVGGALLGQVAEDFPHYCVVATDGDRVVARGLSAPFNASLDGREETPDQGWDRVLVWAARDRRRGVSPTVASALEITVDRDHLGRGLSSRMLTAMREAVGRQGHDVLLAPVRPTAKHFEPRVPMADYALRRREDGLPADPWLRVHVRAGGVIEKVAPVSMTISGSLAQWRRWTGLPFDRDGDIEVPGALVPVHCDIAHDRAVYVEPNVWVRHRARPHRDAGPAGVIE
ncbi:N-acetyltransferase [Streptomyces sp. UNOB3_S3]|uniref:N-acetyltransferase n=1 Tax=Streptomyces sp. UNOB3_S3 TaxID=2871682 RepID=UPI001E28E729|nr:N-acetyltransferase [Streptomyces sp. UNOB3_S3]MCC3776603.1 N-acetyltransferase [Streptomyces sp. UNOB3_S3]